MFVLFNKIRYYIIVMRIWIIIIHHLPVDQSCDRGRYYYFVWLLNTLLNVIQDSQSVLSKASNLEWKSQKILYRTITLHVHTLNVCLDSLGHSSGSLNIKTYLKILQNKNNIEYLDSSYHNVQTQHLKFENTSPTSESSYNSKIVRRPMYCHRTINAQYTFKHLSDKSYPDRFWKERKDTIVLKRCFLL